MKKIGFYLAALLFTAQANAIQLGITAIGRSGTNDIAATGVVTQSNRQQRELVAGS